MRNFDSLSEREILALAISLEEDDERIYADFAEGLRQDFPASAAVFDGMRDEESGHRRRLIELEANRRLFVLQIVQPGLAGLMDGSVSTLAPVFAAAFATHNPWDAFVVGLAASIGAGISMGFAEALSDDGSLTGRGHPWVRGFICGLMTALGGIGHTLPFLIPDFRAAMTAAVLVVVIELGIISWVRHRYMETPARWQRCKSDWAESWFSLRVS